MAGVRGRRQFLCTALGGLAGSALAPAALACLRDTDLCWQSLGGGLSLVTGAGGNVLVQSTPEGTVMVDGGSAAQSRRLLGEVALRGKRAPVVLLFNTHWHPAQTGSNDALGRRGTRILAHENTGLWLGTRIRGDAGQIVHAPLAAHARPNETFHTTGQTQVGGVALAYGHLPPAHTDGDLYVRFPEADVIAVGGALTVARFPQMDALTGGWLGGVVEACDVLLSLMSASTRVVAAEGSVLGRAEVMAQRERATTLRTRITDAMKQGLGVDDMLAQGLTRDYDATWGDPAVFLRSAYRGLWGHVRELGTI